MRAVVSGRIGGGFKFCSTRERRPEFAQIRNGYDLSPSHCDGETAVRCIT
jgi:hypothetical protein